MVKILISAASMLICKTSSLKVTSVIYLQVSPSYINGQYNIVFWINSHFANVLVGLQKASYHIRCRMFSSSLFKLSAWNLVKKIANCQH